MPNSRPRPIWQLGCALWWLSLGLPAWGDERLPSPPRCEVVPLDGHQVSFSLDGVEKVRWQFGDDYPRPYFYPFYGPSGAMLTRMGHPGAPNHDHHQSIWFAFSKLNGLDFWANGSGTTIRQKQWLCYQDGQAEALMAVQLGWYDAEGKEVMQQELIAALLPIAGVEERGATEHALEIQATFKPGGNLKTLKLEQTNFGFLAVRVAKSISDYFGHGELTNSEGAVGEPACFAQPARWMDYSGVVWVGTSEARRSLREGITFFDHPSNTRYPTHWHVRQDGWMGAAYALAANSEISRDQPLVLRYLLHAHSGEYAPERAARIAQQFAERPGFILQERPQPHIQYAVQRLGASK